MPIPNILNRPSLASAVHAAEPQMRLGEPYVRLVNRERHLTLAVLSPDEADELAFGLLEAARLARGEAYPSNIFAEPCSDQWPVPGTVDDAEFGQRVDAREAGKSEGPTREALHQ